MIIIETPAPPTRERLVLVPVGETHAHCRDATPEDLARAGYVLLVGYLPRREVETAVSDAMDLQRRLIEAEAHAAEFHDRCETLRAERNAAQDRAEKAERERDDLLPPDVAAKVAEADRLRKLFDDAGQGEHNILTLIDHYQRNSMDADERLRAVRVLLEENGCDCPCDHHPDERGADCDMCLACRIGEAVGK